MELKEFYHIGIVIAITLIAVSFFIAEYNIQNTEVSSFLQNAEDLKTETENIKRTMEGQTGEESIMDFIEEIPIFGSMVKAGRFLANMVGTLRAGVNVFLGFLQDALSSQVLGIPQSIIYLLIAGIFGSFAFAVYRGLKG